MDNRKSRKADGGNISSEQFIRKFGSEAYKDIFGYLPGTNAKTGKPYQIEWREKKNESN